MTLESLDNALLLDLFQLLDFANLLRAFYGLNNRLDQLIFTKLQRYHLDFHCISKDDFNIICRQYLPCIINRVISFHLSDDVETPNLSHFFLSNGFRFNQFIQLKSLSIDHIHSVDRLAHITSQCRELPYLTHISIIVNTDKYEWEPIKDFINNIWSLKKVTHFSLDVIYPDPIGVVGMLPVSQSISYLFTKNIIYSSNDLSHLFEHTPNLQRFYASHIGYVSKLRTISSSLISLNLIHQIFLPSLENLFQNISNLCYLTLQINDINLDGYAWEKILVKYFKNIKVLRLKMAVKVVSSNHLEGQVDQLLDSFRSHFWIEKHRWFVRCDWCVMGVNSTCLLYTLPYAFNTFHYIEGSQSKSTSPNNLDYSSYDKVQTFEYKKNYFYDNSPFFPIRFVNIRHLKIKFPVDDKFSLLLPTLDRLVSLDAKLHQNIDYSQLQTLLDRAPRLYSLHFCHENDFSMTLFNMTSKSIRRLEFFQNSRFRSRYFRTAECTLLTSSPLGCQCEVLIIDVENRTSVLEFVNSMPNLRALSVRCKYDTKDQNGSCETKKDFTEWLNNHLPYKYTYSIIRSLHNFTHINSWICRVTSIFQEVATPKFTSASKSSERFKICRPS